MINKIETASEADLVKWNSAAMKRLERIWDEVASRMDARAGDDRCGSDACGMAEAERVRANLTDLHRQMDIFGAQYGGVPIARSGER